MFICNRVYLTLARAYTDRLTSSERRRCLTGFDLETRARTLAQPLFYVIIRDQRRRARAWLTLYYMLDDDVTS